MVKHGMSKTRLYRTWASMKWRCDPVKGHKRYGLRGIAVCEEWQEFKNFAKWALAFGYQDDLTIDRINGDLGYSPENCRWITMQEQAQNKAPSTIEKYEALREQRQLEKERERQSRRRTPEQRKLEKEAKTYRKLCAGFRDQLSQMVKLRAGIRRHSTKDLDEQIVWTQEMIVKYEAKADQYEKRLQRSLI